MELHLAAAAGWCSRRQAVEVRRRNEPPDDRGQIQDEHHHVDPGRVGRNRALEIGGVRLHEARGPQGQARLGLQGSKFALALDRDDQVSMVIVSVDLKRHELAARGEHRVHGEQVFSDAASLGITELHRVAA